MGGRPQDDGAERSVLERGRISEMANVPVLRSRGMLFVTLPEDIDDIVARRMLDDLLRDISRTSTDGVVIDISALDIVDSFLGRIVSEVANCASIMDVETVVCGMRPSVAMTLVELGMEFPKVTFAMNMDHATDLLAGEVPDVLGQSG